MYTRHEFACKPLFNDKGWQVGSIYGEKIVRCKDCQENDNGFCNLTYLNIDDKDFCSKGTRLFEDDQVVMVFDDDE